jgi:hypothetical protein
MKKFHPFFIIGTVGTIITSILHVFLALGLSVSSAHSSFYILYPSFIALLVIGFGLTLKKQKESKTT